MYIYIHLGYYNLAFFVVSSNRYARTHDARIVVSIRLSSSPSSSFSPTFGSPCTFPPLSILVFHSFTFFPFLLASPPLFSRSFPYSFPL